MRPSSDLLGLDMMATTCFPEDFEASMVKTRLYTAGGLDRRERRAFDLQEAHF